MNRIILYSNRKVDPSAYDASTPELTDKAFLKLFKVLDEEWRCYCPGNMKHRERNLYDKAKEGCADSARILLTSRRGYEYEEWDYVDVE